MCRCRCIYFPAIFVLLFIAFFAYFRSRYFFLVSLTANACINIHITFIDLSSNFVAAAAAAATATATAAFVANTVDNDEFQFEIDLAERNTIVSAWLILLFVCAQFIFVFYYFRSV